MRSVLTVMALLIGFPAFADDLPDPALTPGAVAETSTDVICAPGYARAHRVWHDKAGTLAKYGVPPEQASQYEDDDVVPVCLGGDNTSPLNHWPQQRNTALGAAEKDRLEVRICSKVCRDRDDAELQHYQAAFAKDWIALLQAENANAAQ